jgi:hypothetical protein
MSIDEWYSRKIERILKELCTVNYPKITCRGSEIICRDKTNLHRTAISYNKTARKRENGKLCKGLNLKSKHIDHSEQK